MISGLLVGGLLIGSLAGCGSKAPVSTASSSSEAPAASSSSSEASSAASADASTKEIDLTYWNPFTGDDGKTMVGMVDAFNKQYAGKIKVTTQTMASDDYYAKLPVVASAQSGVPDVAILHIDRLPYFSSKGMIEAMDGDISSMGLSRNDFIQATWDAGIQSDGKRYSLPLDTHPYVMFYNKTMLKELGYTEDDLKNLKGDKFLEMCKKATKGDKYGVGFYWTGMSSMFYTLLSQYGGTLLSKDAPGKATFNSDAGVKALTFIKNLESEGLTNKPGADHVALFRQGKSLFCVDGIWSSTGMDAVQGLDWGEMFPPLVGDKGAVWANSHNLCIFKQPKLDSDRRAADDTFIKYLSDNSITWAKGGQVPARLSVQSSPEFKALKWSFAANQLDWFTYTPITVTSGNMIDALNPVLLDYFSGKIKDPKAALDQAAKAGEATAAETLAK